MKHGMFVSISIAFAVAASSGGLAQVSHSSLAEITREGRYWVQTINGAATATPLDRVRLDTVGNVVLQGDNGEKVTYKLKLRVRARDAREAEGLLREFDVKYRTQNGWLRLTVTPPANISEGPELSVNVPRSLQQVWIETRGGNVQATDLEPASSRVARRPAAWWWTASRGALKYEPAAAISRWARWGARCGAIREPA